MKKVKLIMGLLVVLMVMSLSTSALGAENPAPTKDIVDTALEAGEFKTLAAALEKAGLVNALKGDGPFTVFAPTDAAFEKLLKELNVTPEQLLEREDLATILQYHVVPGKVMSRDLKEGMKAKTLATKEVTFSLNPARVNNANIVKPDIQASNGVIHVIDTVLIPAN
ncbi:MULTISPECIES: fasciclin domain-containing protein [Sutcliffiella]|nr:MULTISPECIES: fasciclin domain-containing protein [Sutcliffiella]MED4017723.1 fasciclin domain-containing protein [Sutcliffiella cohnii]WBL16753.1 fasciclin domain-containing protein [Sutcliffiella sp. NC1]